MSAGQAIETTVASAREGTAPRLAPGVELLGPSEDGDAPEPSFLYRLSDGQAVKVSRLIHLVALRLDGTDVGEIARQVTDELGRRLSPDNVSFLIDQKLRPLGLVQSTADDGDRSTPPTPPTPLLGLRFRAGLVPGALVRGATAVLRPLFRLPVVVAVLAGVAATDLWLFLDHGVTGGIRQVLHQPALVPAVWGLVLLAGVFHELGHATACRYGGGRPGRIGFGLYLVWPVFYSDVTDSYRLDRRGRLRTDLGGVYFNMVFVLAMAGVYAVAGWQFALVVIVVQHMAMLQQLLPFVRLDGYYVVADLVGVPDLFAYVKPIVRSVVLRRTPAAAVASLGRGARRVVTAWVLLTIPVLGASLALLAVHLPDWVAIASESVTVQVRRLAEAIDGGGVVPVIGPLVEAAALVLPLLAVTLTLLLSVVRVGRRLAGWVRPHRRGAVRTVETPVVPPDDQRKDDSPVEETTNDRAVPVPDDVPALDHPSRPSARPQLAFDNGNGWDAHRDPGASLEEARAAIGRQADELVETVSRTIDAARQELHLARAVRATAEEEADAIRAAARRDAAEVVAQTRNAVETLLQDVWRRLDGISTETLVR